MKSLLTFIAGLCVGIIVALYYDILSKPALPTEPVLDLDADWVDPDVYLDNNLRTYWDAVHNQKAPVFRAKKYLDDAQPVKVEA